METSRAPLLQTEFLFDLHLEVETPATAVCPTPAGERKIFVVRGGIFEGPRAKGIVLPGGVDWGLAGAERVFHLNVRAILRTDDGSLITITYKGLRDLSNDYWRTTPTFETTSESYRSVVRVVGWCVVPNGPLFVVACTVCLAAACGVCAVW